MPFTGKRRRALVVLVLVAGPLLLAPPARGTEGDAATTPAAVPTPVPPAPDPQVGARPGGPVEPPATAYRIIVRWKAGVVRSERGDARAAAGVDPEGAMALPHTELVDPEPGQDLPSAIRALERSGDVLYAEPDRPRTAFRAPDDEYFGLLWGLRKRRPAGGRDADGPARGRRGRDRGVGRHGG